MKTIIIDCDECIMRATATCNDCLVTHILDRHSVDGDPDNTGPGNADPGNTGQANTGQANTGQANTGPCHRGGGEAIVFDIAEQRAVHWFAEAGMVPTLRHRAASSS